MSDSHLKINQQVKQHALCGKNLKFWNMFTEKNRLLIILNIKNVAAQPVLNNGSIGKNRQINRFIRHPFESLKIFSTSFFLP
jgi:hypothetical protein